MLDYNHRPGIAERINAAVDAALEAERAETPPRDYLGGSRLGHPCERALQFEFVGAPKDEHRLNDMIPQSSMVARDLATMIANMITFWTTKKMMVDQPCLSPGLAAFVGVDAPVLSSL